MVLRRGYFLPFKGRGREGGALEETNEKSRKISKIFSLFLILLRYFLKDPYFWL